MSKKLRVYAMPQGESVEGPKVGDQPIDKPSNRQLQSVDAMVERVIPEQFKFFDANGASHRERSDALGGEFPQVQTHGASHGEAQDVNPFDFISFQPVDQIAGMGSRTVIRQTFCSNAKTRQVR